MRGRMDFLQAKRLYSVLYSSMNPESEVGSQTYRKRSGDLSNRLTTIKEGTMKQKMTFRRVLAICLMLAMLCSILPFGVFAVEVPMTLEEAPLYPYQDTSLSFEERAVDLVSRMTQEEKYQQLYNGRTPDAPAIPRLGVRQYRWWSEALHGVARDGVATSFPTGLGIAATWDVDLVQQMMQATADEARDKFNSRENPHGLSYWSPTINMSRDPRWGRAEESYGEDPHLTGQIAEAFVKGLQGAAAEKTNTKGETYLEAIATPKHFLGNNSEGNRHTGSSNIDERDLREYYTYAFKNAVENGKAESIMTSYNAVNGVPMSVNEPILDGMLRRTWGFDGYVVTDCDTLSDVKNNHKWRPDDADNPWRNPAEWTTTPTWGGQEATAFTMKAGVDANCGTTMATNVKGAIEAGLMTEGDVDKALVRQFTARMKTGEFDPQNVVGNGPFGAIDGDIANKTYQQLAEDSSDNAVVMLKNDSNFLPLGNQMDQTAPSLVLVGPQAKTLELGDYSVANPYGTSTANQGIEAAFNRYCESMDVTGIFTYIAGAPSTGSGGNYLMNVKPPQLKSEDGTVLRTLNWNNKSDIQNCKVESAGNLGYMGKSDVWVKMPTVDFTNVTKMSIQMAGDTNACRTTMEIRLGSPTGQLVATMKQGVGDSGGWSSYQTYEFEYTGATGGYGGVQENVYFVFSETPAEGTGFSEDEEKTIREADAVIFFAGTRQGENGYFENTDGYNLNLPGDQTKMITATLDLNPKTVVYMQAVSQINVEPFKDRAPAILWSTYNGQAQGNAAGRLLFGEKNPSAKLPFSWYSDVNELADVKDYQMRADGSNKGRTYQYFTGNISYPFGYGLSYSTFEYSDLTLSKSSVTPDDTITVEFDVKNTSTVDGQEVGELYVASPDAAANDRPEKRLKGFAKKEIEAGATEHFTIELPVSDLWFWDADNDVQVYDQGEYTIQVGPDSGNTPLTAQMPLSGQLTPSLNVTRAIPDGHILDTAKPDQTITTALSACNNDQTFVDLSTATVEYTSSKPNVATVDENGVVTAVGGGIASITATVTVNGVSKSDTFAVAVMESIAATGITVGGVALADFDPDKTAYSANVDEFDPMPQVAATATEGTIVTVEQATPEHPVATITLTKGEVKKIYTVSLNMVISAAGITVDGKPLFGFDPDKTEYTVMVGTFDPLPVVAATAAEGISVAVEQATAANPVATITLTKSTVTKVYQILFSMRLTSFDFTTATSESLKSTWAIKRENAEKWALDENGLTITTEYGDLYRTSNNAKNMFYQEAPGDWEVELSFKLDKLPSEKYQQVSLIAYQDDDNYLKIGYQGSNDTNQAVQINAESSGQFTDTAPFSKPLRVTELTMRLKKAGNTYTGAYSTDGKVFTELGSKDANLSNVKIVVTANNGTGDGGPVKAILKNFTVLSSGESYDFKNLTNLPAGWSIVNPTENGVTFGADGATIHTTNKDGVGAVDNQLGYGQTLTGNWIVETHFTNSRALQANWEQFGIYFTNASGDCVRVNVEHGDDGVNAQLVILPKNGDTIHKSPTVGVGECKDIYFRMKRVDNIFELYYSLDGENWNFLGSETATTDFSEGTLQLYATSQKAGNASYDSTVEYCNITKNEGAMDQWSIGVTDNGCCDVTYVANPEGTSAGTVPDGGKVTFTVTPKEGKLIGKNTIALGGVTGTVSKTKDATGVWTVVVSQIKSDITLTVTETIGATGITLDGRGLKGFAPDKTAYLSNVVELPKLVAATAPAGIDVSVAQATEENPVATVTLTRASDSAAITYTINFEVTDETTQASNPYLPLWEHIPDGEPHVFEDPDNPDKYRVYIYGSHDSNRTSYCGKEYVTWSAPVDDLTAWRYEGQIYSCADASGGTVGDTTLFAPDVCYKDGIYYLYVHDWGHGQKIRVATSDRPDGPFTYQNEGGHDAAIVQDPNRPSGDTRVDFDPAVLVDDDGNYLYWGGHQRTGFGSGELDEDMMTVKSETWTRSNMTNAEGGNHETGEPFRFFEGPSIRKVEGKYVLVYAQKVPKDFDEGAVNGDYRARLAYAYSDQPLGPWTYGGVIIDNGGEVVVPGSQTSYDDGNNHGGIVEINGQWYVFYHRMTQGNEYARQGMLEPITVTVTGDGKVVIPEVEMTSQGANIDGLDAYRQQDAGLACYLTGGAKITSGYRENPDYNPIVSIKNGVVAGYKYLNFGTGAAEGKALKLALDLKAKGEAGTIEIYIDKPNSEKGKLIGAIPVAAGAGGYQTAETSLSNVTGKHAVYFVFKSAGTGEICEINKFQFFNDSDPNAVTGITLSQNTLGLEPGEEAQLAATVTPPTAEDKTVVWTSSNEDVATVDQSGLVTAISLGSADIIATAGGKSATCAVKVRNGLKAFDFTQAADKNSVRNVWDVVRENEAKWSVGEDGLTILTEKGDLYMNYTNDARNMFYQEAPGDWEVETYVELDKVLSENYQQVSMIAYQDDDNYLKINYQGNSSGKKAVEINVEKNGNFQNTAPFSQSLETTKIWMRLKKVGDNYTGSYSVDGVSFTELGTQNWPMQDVKLVLTANNGTGSASEVKADFKYLKLVEDPNVSVESVTLNKNTLALKVGNAEKLTATVLPKDATDKAVTWASSKESVATVDSEGNVTAKSEGTAIITVTTVDGGHTASCTVTVKAASDGGGSGSGTTRYSISVKQSEGGKISPASTSVEKGKSQAFTIKANAGYKIASVLVDGKSVGAVSSYTFQNVKENHTISAVFEKMVVKLPFTDVGVGDWFRDAVEYAYGNGLMNGTSATKFSPSGETTRGMIVTILYRLEKEPAVGKAADFTDVAKDQYYADAVAWAAENGIVNGYGNGKFGPDDNVTREQLAVTLYRYAAYIKADTSAEGKLDSFRDASQISEYAKEAMKWAVGSGLVTGKGNQTLDPKGSATRAEIATILMRFCNL